MESAAPSPFLEVPEADWVWANALCFAIVDSYPVSPGHGGSRGCAMSLWSDDVCRGRGERPKV
jgi:hypothetical protein